MYVERSRQRRKGRERHDGSMSRHPGSAIGLAGSDWLIKLPQENDQQHYMFQSGNELSQSNNLTGFMA